MRTISAEQFYEELRKQKPPTIEATAFICPICSTVQSANSLIKAGAGADIETVFKYVGFSCVGRFTNAGAHQKGEATGRGCDWTLDGLFQLHKLEVTAADGTTYPHFEIATHQQAQDLEAQS